MCDIKKLFFEYYNLVENDDVNEATFESLYDKYLNEKRKEHFIAYVMDMMKPLECKLNYKSIQKLECKLSSNLVPIFNHMKQEPDGNCLFHSLGYIFDSNYKAIKKEIIDYILKNQRGLLLQEWFKYQLNYEYQYKTVNEYIEGIKLDKFYGGIIEIYIASRIKKANIVVYSSIDGSIIEQMSGLTKYIYKESDKNFYLYSCNLTTNQRNHFDVLEPKIIPPVNSIEYLFQNLDSGSININSSISIKDKFIQNIQSDQYIDMEMPLNIVFYASGNAKIEIFFIEQLLNAGYLVKNIILIDSVYHNPTYNLTSMRQNIKELYNINVLLCKDYNEYTIFLTVSNIFIHYIVSINYEHGHNPLIYEYEKSISDDVKLIELYKTKKFLFPSNIIFYNSTGIEITQNLIQFHTNRLDSDQKNYELLKQEIIIQNNREELKRKENEDHQRLISEYDPNEQARLFQAYRNVGGHNNHKIISKKEYIKNKRNYIKLQN